MLQARVLSRAYREMTRFWKNQININPETG